MVKYREVCCPLCRSEYRLGANSIEGLPRNRYLEHIIEKMRTGGRIQETQPQTAQTAQTQTTQIIQIQNPQNTYNSNISYNTTSSKLSYPPPLNYGNSSNESVSDLNSSWQKVTHENTTMLSSAIDNSFNPGIFDPPSMFM